MSSLFSPILISFSTIAFSVGSPIIFVLLLSSTFISQSVHNAPNSTTFFASFAYISTIFISFCVNVPVLSEHITVLLPSVSTAGNFLIILFFFAIFVTPIESTIVTIAGNPSGIAATASPTDVINISIGSIFLITPITKIIIHIIKHATPKIFPTCPSFICIGVSGALFSIIIFAIFPTSVCIPISVTIAFPCPFTTILAIYPKFFLSPIGLSLFPINSASFSDGIVSPVRLDSSIFN